MMTFFFYYLLGSFISCKFNDFNCIFTFFFLSTLNKEIIIIIIVGNTFPLVITVMSTFTPLVIVGNTFLLVITVGNTFPLVITVGNMFPPLITFGNTSYNC